MVKRVLWAIFGSPEQLAPLYLPPRRGKSSKGHIDRLGAFVAVNVVWRDDATPEELALARIKGRPQQQVGKRRRR
jgi:hypothetical protein